MRRTRGSSGQAAVEAALVLPLLIVLLMAVLSFGLLFTVELVISNASREGARFGTLGKSTAQIETLVLDYLDQSRLTAASASVSVTGAGGASGADVTVQITYPVQLIIPVPGLPNPVDVQSVATMRIE